MARAWTRCRTVALRLRDSRRDVLPPPRAALHLGALRRWCLSQTAQTREALPPYATLQHRASTLIIVEEIVPPNAEKVNGLGCFSRDSLSAARKPGHRPTDRPPAGSGGCGHPPLHARTAVSRCRGAFYMRPDCTAGPPKACEETELPYGRPYRPPLRRVFYLVRRAGCPHPAKPGCRNHQGPRSSRPGHGGMWACRPTRFGGGAAGTAGLFGRIYNPPLHVRTAVSRCRGALYMRPRRTAGPPQACEETELPCGRP